jgi:hypothetical protein
MGEPILGVDPGTSTTALAIVMDAAVAYSGTMPWGEALSRIEELCHVWRLKRAVVEMPRTGVFYARHASKKGAPKTVSGQIKIIQNVGKNMGISQLIVERCRQLKIVTIVRHPEKGNTKWDAEYWCRVFGWPGRPPSEHARDAACLALRYEKWYGWVLPNPEELKK